jgi:serine/threonine-protein kinase
LKCLHKVPPRRYPTAEALAADLGRFLEGEPVSIQQSGLLDRLAGALDRVQLQAQFAAYGSLLLWLAPCMFLPEVYVNLVIAFDGPSYLVALGQFGQIAGVLVVLGYFRDWQWAPRGAAERQLWFVWGGYILAGLTFAISGRLLFGYETAVELQFYQGLAALTALAFFALAGNFWGYCALIGLCFLALTFVMAANLLWAPIEFGATWAVVLVLFGLRLRRLGMHRL